MICSGMKKTIPKKILTIRCPTCGAAPEKSVNLTLASHGTSPVGTEHWSQANQEPPRRVFIPASVGCQTDWRNRADVVSITERAVMGSGQSAAQLHDPSVYFSRLSTLAQPLFTFRDEFSARAFLRWVFCNEQRLESGRCNLFEFGTERP